MFMQQQWHPHNISAHLQLLSFNSAAAMPPWLNWDINPSLDFPTMLHKSLLTEPTFLHLIYPTLQMLLCTNIHNLQWAASVATTLALVEAIGFLSARPDLRHSAIDEGRTAVVYEADKGKTAVVTGGFDPPRGATIVKES